LYRYPDNPIITRQDIKSRHPALQDVSSVFNPGGVRYEGQFLLLLRVQNRARETFFVKALSKDGIHFVISDLPVQILHLERCKHRIYHIYDARITADKSGFYHVFCAMDTDKGCWLGYFRSEDFDSLDFIGLASEPDTRNGVLLPGTNYRFERPNKHIGADGVKTGSRIVCSKSLDMLHWQEVAEVFSGRPHYWDELIGSGPPPLLCEAGWLHIYHGVATHFGSSNIYQAGISLQDKDRPWITLARGRYNILEPRENYELCGQVPNVIFPSAAIPLSDSPVLDNDTPIYIYYGAADTAVALAITTPAELIAQALAQ
jgi:beta-1,4-mannooligosaccharide/beta-1,4-mannosyl-N-acetylglucosamine phosphorylase